MSEKEKINFGPETGEKPIEIIDVQSRKEHLPNEVVDWMQKVETNQTQINIMSDLASQQTPNQQTIQTNNDLTKLSTTRTTFVTGFKSTVQEAHRWLSEFILRMIKIKKGKVQFKEE